MDEDTQKFMALEGLHTWGHGVLIQVERLEKCQEGFLKHTDWPAPMRHFIVERHLFLIAVNKLFEHIDWVRKLAFMDDNQFSLLEPFRKEVKSLRDMNEHNIEYFKGGGRTRDKWVHTSDLGTADASATVGSKIGGRLDWNSLVEPVTVLLRSIPPMYVSPTSEK